MLKFLFSLLAFSVLFNGLSQTDSTDLELSMSDATIETALDSMLYLDGSFQNLSLDFSIGDTIAFSKVHIELGEVESGQILFRKSYPLTDLESDSLIEAWDVSIPFGNVLDTNSYQVAIIIENYDGSLGSAITKMITP